MAKVPKKISMKPSKNGRKAACATKPKGSSKKY
jgi:hypothetical protein